VRVEQAHRQAGPAERLRDCLQLRDEPPTVVVVAHEARLGDGVRGHLVRHARLFVSERPWHREVACQGNAGAATASRQKFRPRYNC
jgi:hypothetical protein